MSLKHPVMAARRSLTRWGGTWLGLLIAALLALPALAPLANPGVPLTYDLPFHVARMMELRQAIAIGELFPRWVQPFVAGLGFPFFDFYPPLAYYLATSLTTTGLTEVAAYKLAAAFTIILASVAMYAWMVHVLREAGARRTRLHCSALTASAAYVYAPYFLADIYRRGALPESLGLALLPLMFLSFERLLRRPGLETVPLAAISVAVVVLAHNVASVLGIGLLACYTAYLAFASRLVSRVDGYPASAPRMVLNAAFAVALGLGISAFVWLPLLMERSYLSATFQFLQSGLFDTNSRLTNSWPPLQFSLVFDYGKFHDDWGQLYRAGLVEALVALTGLGPLVYFRRHEAHPHPPIRSGAGSGRARGLVRLAVRASFFTLATIALVLVLTPFAGFVWRAPILRSFQFPWRVQGAIALTLAFLAGSGVYWLSNRWQKSFPFIQLIFVISLALSGLLKLPSNMVPDPALSLGAIHRYTSLAGWSPPQNLPQPQFSSADVSGLARLSNLEEGPGYVRLGLQASQPTTVVLHMLYFPGWRVYVDGVEVPGRSVSPQGLLGFKVNKGSHNVVARFEATPLRQLADLVSLLSALGLLAIIIVSLARRKVPLVAMAAITALAVIYIGVRLAGVSNSQEEFHSLDLPPSNGVRLLGVGLDRTREGAMGVTLYWQTLRRLNEMDSFVALLDGHGHAVGKPMREPMDGAYPTSQWQIGEIVADRVEVEPTSEIDLSDLSVAAGLRPFDATGSSSPVVSFVAPLTAVEATKPKSQPKVVVDNALALEKLDYPAVVAPGDTLKVGLDWQALGVVKGDVGTYLHLTDGNGKSVAQFDGPAGPPAFPAVLWEKGELVHEVRALHLPAGIPPGRYSLRLGAYRYPNLEPLPLTSVGRQASDASVDVADVFVVANKTRPTTVRPSSVLKATFGGRIELLGFDLASKTLRAGDTLTLTTYWQSRQKLSVDYTLFAQLLDGSGKVRAQKDGEPADGSYPTSIWKPGEYVVDKRTLAVGEGVPPGEYHLIVGLYRWPDLRRLPVVISSTKAGDALDLGIVKVVAK